MLIKRPVIERARSATCGRFHWRHFQPCHYTLRRTYALTGSHVSPALKRSELSSSTWAHFHKNINFCTSAEAVQLSSYLCIPPSQSQKHVAILTPYLEHLDFTPEGISTMKRNLEQRGLPAVDLEGLGEDLSRCRQLRAEARRLDAARTANVKEIRQKRDRGMTDEQIADLFESGHCIKTEAKTLAQTLMDLEENLMPKILALPNDIHPKTSWSVDRSKAIADRKDSEAIADDEGSDDRYTRAGSGPYYQGQVAMAELAAAEYFSDRFVESGFVPFSGPDFCKSIVVEGCHLDFNDPAATFHLTPEEDFKPTEYHLVGSASLQPFCAYFTKTSVPSHLLPLKYFSVGRHYGPPRNCALHSAQSSRLHFFLATDSQSAEDDAFSSCIEVLAGIYKKLGFCCEAVDSTAAELSRAESRCTRLRAWLPSSGTHRTVASVASCGDFISKRLWLFQHDDAKDTSGFLRVVHGVGMSFPALLDCIADNGPLPNGQLQFPEPLLNSWPFTETLKSPTQ